MKKSLRDAEVAERKVLVRVDFNVPLAEGKVADDTRIRAAFPTIKYLLERRARVILCTHLGRPGGRVVEELRLNPVAARLSGILDTRVLKANDCVGPSAEEAVELLGPGQVLLLENVRFHPEEEANDPDFASRLAGLADIYVNDAFAAAHRAHASTEGVAHYLPAVAGLLMKLEIDYLEAVAAAPREPLVAIFGGIKVTDKIGVIERFLDRLQRLMIGGGMGAAFLKARGVEVGRTPVDAAGVETAGRIIEQAGDKLVLPRDLVVADGFDPEAERRVVEVDDIPSGWQVMDIGPLTVASFEEILETARTVLWNGPVGVAEMEPFAEGTNRIARKLAELDAVTIVGGGDTMAAVNRIGIAERLTHVSTGGGAFLEFLAGRELPGIRVLQEKEPNWSHNNRGADRGSRDQVNNPASIRK